MPVDNEGMDLSKLLGDVYDHDATAPRPSSPSQPATAPEWSDEAHLDKVFADWTPGPADGASHHEHDIIVDAPAAHAPLDDDLAAALSAALTDAGTSPNEVSVDLPESPDLGEVLPWPDTDSQLQAPSTDLWSASAAAAPVVEAQPPVATHEHLSFDEPPMAPAPARSWQRSDDDILPGRAARKAAKAPKAHKLRKRG